MLMTVISLTLAVLIGWAISPILNFFMAKEFNLNLDTIFMVSALSITLFIGFSILLNIKNQLENRNSSDKRTFESKLTKLEM